MPLWLQHSAAVIIKKKWPSDNLKYPRKAYFNPLPVPHSSGTFIKNYT